MPPPLLSFLLRERHSISILSLAHRRQVMEVLQGQATVLLPSALQTLQMVLLVCLSSGTCPKESPKISLRNRKQHMQITIPSPIPINVVIIALGDSALGKQGALRCYCHFCLFLLTV